MVNGTVLCQQRKAKLDNKQKTENKGRFAPIGKGGAVTAVCGCVFYFGYGYVIVFTRQSFDIGLQYRGFIYIQDHEIF
jgi:hypothetical protein